MNIDCVKELFFWLTKRLRYLNLARPPHRALRRTARRIGRDDAFRSRVENLIHDADFGIDGICPHVVNDVYDKMLANEMPFSETYRSEHKDFFDRVTAGDLPYTIEALHCIPNSDKTVPFLLKEESNGTQRFLGILGPILEALDRGDLLVVDELDCSMHPLLTCKLVEMFQSAAANPKGAQLVFATHDTNLMTPALFRRDEIWLTEKAAGGGTELFSLADIKSKPRKDGVFEKHYLAGRYGAVPSFGPALENF
jgi:hypothetical protein